VPAALAAASIAFLLLTAGSARAAIADVVPPPTATTGLVTSVADTHAWLPGSLDANGLEPTYWFEYGTDTSYGSETSKDVLDAVEETDVVTFVGGLTPGTTYHYRLVVETSSGTAYGEGEQFTTESGGPSSTLTIALDAIPDATQDFSFSGSGAIGAFVLDGDPGSATPASSGFTSLATGTYTVSLAALSGWPRPCRLPCRRP
jgi:hypothetical protein